MANNALSDTPGNKQLNKAEALTNGEKQMPQTSKTAEGKGVHLLAEGRNFNDNEIYGFGPPTSQIDTSPEIDNGSISRNTIHNATQKTANSQNSTDRAFNTDPGIDVKKDSREAMMTNYMGSPLEKGKISEETVMIVYKCGKVPISERTAICTREENRKDSETIWNDTSSSTETSESKTSWNHLSLTESYSETKTKIKTAKDTFSKKLDTSKSDHTDSFLEFN